MSEKSIRRTASDSDVPKEGINACFLFVLQSLLRIQALRRTSYSPKPTVIFSEEAKEAQKITEKEAPQLDKSLEEEVVIDSKPEKLTIAKSKTQTILERKFRENLAQHGGRGTITVPHNMRKIHKSREKDIFD